MSKRFELELFFKKSIFEIFKDLHLDRKISLNELSKQSGIPRQTIANIFKSNNLKYRTVAEATKLTKNKGKNHWAFGKSKDNCELLKIHSKRMKDKNPSKEIKSTTKAAIKRSEYFKKNLLKQEIEFKKHLDKHEIEYFEQFPFGPYVLDFFVPSKALCIEIDSTSKWGKQRMFHALKRDKFLLEHGLLTLRINKNTLQDTVFINNIFKAYNLIS